MEDCIFCKIIAGEVPTTKVYEDEDVFAFLDIAPVNPGHTLVIPKEHVENIGKASDDQINSTLTVVRKLAPSIVKASSAQGFNVNTNSGAAAGQSVFHLHFHVIPRHDGDGKITWEQGSYGEGEEQVMAEKIKSNL
ncbi:HIT family protein [bacterium]|nr:HIT family protein [bacterium]|tara:strand:- start:191 stop:598 length:408 start_codon:yes stop_codon:yes gene_type:complete